MTDQLVQAAYSFGGDAVSLQHWIFGATGGKFELPSGFSTSGGVKAARIEGRDLVMTLYKQLASDAMRRASGEEEMRLTQP